jgi:hypothetical protein
VFGFEVHLIDEVPPIIVSAEDTVCLQVLENTFIVAYDECGTALITRLDEISNGDCGMEVTRKFEITDECGNTTTFTQFIYVMEGELSGIHFIESIQEVIDAGDSLIVECSGVNNNSLTRFGPEAIVIEGDCSQISEITYEETILEVYTDCHETGIKYAVESTWTIVGLCGGESTISLTVYIKDTTAPTLLYFQKEATVECGYPYLEIVAVDNCGDVDLSITEIETDGNCPGELIVERLITATDDCGNTLEMVQILNVVGTKGPVFVSDPYSCYEDYGIEVFDECTGEIVDPEFLGLGTIQDCEGGGQLIEHLWAATDACGNTSYFEKYLLKDDVLPPEILIADETLKELVEGNITTVYTSQTEFYNAILKFDRYSAIGYDNCDIVLFPTFYVNIEGNDCEKLYSFR